MAFDLYNNEFLQHNALRSYPFANGTSRRPTIGTNDFQIPNDFLVGVSIAVTANPVIVDPGGFFLQRLSCYPHGYTLTLGYRQFTGEEDYADVSVARTTLLITDFENNTSVIPLVPLEPDFHGIQGHVTIGGVSNISTLLTGEWIFDWEASKFDPDTVCFLPRCISTIKVTNSDGSFQTVYGDVELVAGTNVRFNQTAENNRVKITINVQQTEEEAANVKAVYTINGIHPNSVGNFNITADSECLEITDVLNGIKFSETCAQPCCDCEELTKLIGSIESVASAASNILRYQQSLEQQLRLVESAIGVTGIGGITE